MASPVVPPVVSPDPLEPGLWARIQSETVYNDVVDNWFLMNSWVPVVGIVVAYLFFVLYWGPRWMADKKPYQIKNILLVYNLVQTLYNAYIVAYLFLPGVPTYLWNHSCVPLPREDNPNWLAFCEACHLYYLSKIIDLLDTVFFVMKKKQSQITFLHVYHHAMMVLTSWGFLRFYKGEQAIFVGSLNSLVHVVMYSYYFLAAFGPHVQKYLWWKKYITKFQLIQFGLMCLQQVSLIVFECQMPIVLTYYITFQALVMVVLFGNFYYQTYIKKNK
uniref:Elongation of very long chain fatty acids protein n=1 Tax=Cacopsylla melanoneura TaxID=428564 RepID=A0A8D8TRL8_9HEMI